MIGNQQPCPLCKQTAHIEMASHADFYFVGCQVCGRYFIELSLKYQLEKSSDFTGCCQVSAFTRARTIRNQEDIIIVRQQYRGTFGDNPHITLEEITNQFPSTLSERLDRILLNIAQLSRFPGDKVSLAASDYPLFYVELPTDIPGQFEFLRQQLVSEDYISHTLDDLTNRDRYWLTAKGWSQVVDLQRGNMESNQGFIAMWFDDSISSEPFRKAIREAGYEAFRIDQKEHVNQISDEIIAEIRRSKFVVADFTGSRGGVYYEAGFATGLGIPVIWTCRTDWEKEIHFDIRQYNTIFWSDDTELEKRLYNRIRAIIT